MTEDEWLASSDPAAMLRALPEIVCCDNEQAPEGLGVSDRKLRLFACACCRHPAVWPLLTDVRSRTAVEVAEKYADGAAGEAEVTAAQDAVSELLTDPPGSPQRYAELMARHTLMSGGAAAMYVARSQNIPAGVVQADYADLLRAIVGNPFRPFTVANAYRTPLVLGLARAAYEERACLTCGHAEAAHRGHAHQPGTPEPTHCSQGCGCRAFVTDGALDPMRLAILADALEDAGVPEMVECPNVNHKALDRHGPTWGKLGPCGLCHGAGRIHDPLLARLRSKGPFYRGEASLDCVLGKE